MNEQSIFGLNEPSEVAKIETGTQEFVSLDAIHSAAEKGLEDPSIFAQSRIDPPKQVVLLPADLVVVCIAAHIRTEALVCPTLQFVSTFLALTFHDAKVDRLQLDRRMEVFLLNNCEYSISKHLYTDTNI